MEKPYTNRPAQIGLVAFTLVKSVEREWFVFFADSMDFFNRL